MKKRILFLGILAAVLGSAFVIYFLAIPNRPAGGSVKADKITAQSLFSPFEPAPHTDGTVLTLTFDCSVGSGVAPRAAQLFFVKLDGDDALPPVYKLLEAAAQANPHVTETELARERYLVISTDIPNLRYALIAPVQDEDASKAVFNFLPLQGLFFDMAPAELYALPHGTSEDSFAAYIPYHLFDDPSLFSLSPPSSLDRTLYNTHLRHQTGRLYETSGSMADFRAFYESLGLYEISEEGGRLILEGSLSQKTAGETGGTLAPSGKIFLDFTEENGRRFVAYSFQTA